MKVIGSVGVFALLLGVATTAPASAQMAEMPLDGKAGTTNSAIDATAPAASRTDPLQAAVSPDLLAGVAPIRLTLAPESRAADLRTSALVPFALEQQQRRRGMTFLLVGASLLAAGLLIDGDAGTAVSVGGAIVGAYGVYLLVRR